MIYYNENDFDNSCVRMAGSIVKNDNTWSLISKFFKKNI